MMNVEQFQFTASPDRDRPGRRWNFVSDDAKNLIRGLMKFEASARATATYHRKISGMCGILRNWPLKKFPRNSYNSAKQQAPYNTILMDLYGVVESTKNICWFMKGSWRMTEWSHGKQGVWAGRLGRARARLGWRSTFQSPDSLGDIRYHPTSESSSFYQV